MNTPNAADPDSLMALCQAQARLALPLCRPNPAVGAVLVGPGGQVLGLGHTQQPGGPHAEVMALQAAAQAGHTAAGATMYVTLEPCSHQGRTGPCCERLIEAGIRKVVASVTDPNPLVAGRGFERLRAAGVEVDVGDGAQETRELNLGFFSRMLRQRPWVRLKLAASLDGKTALANGNSQWITGEAARADGHAWRQRAGTVLTGVGTVLHDNPRLDARLASGATAPDLVVVDSRLRTPADAQLFEPRRRVVIYCAEPDPSRRAALAQRGATVVSLPATPDAGGPTQVDLAAMLRDLAQREVNELHVEAGPTLNGALLRQGLADEMLVYLAPLLLGAGRDMAVLGPFSALSQGTRLAFTSVQPLGPDVRLLARLAGHEAWLA